MNILKTIIRQEKEIKSVQILNEEAKLSLCADDMILYIENQKKLQQNTVRINKLIQKIIINSVK